MLLLVLVRPSRPPPFKRSRRNGRPFCPVKGNRWSWRTNRPGRQPRATAETATVRKSAESWSLHQPELFFWISVIFHFFLSSHIQTLDFNPSLVPLKLYFGSLNFQLFILLGILDFLLEQTELQEALDYTFATNDRENDQFQARRKWCIPTWDAAGRYLSPRLGTGRTVTRVPTITVPAWRSRGNPWLRCRAKSPRFPRPYTPPPPPSRSSPFHPSPRTVSAYRMEKSRLFIRGAMLPRTLVRVNCRRRGIEFIACLCRAVWFSLRIRVSRDNRIISGRCAMKIVHYIYVNISR